MLEFGNKYASDTRMEPGCHWCLLSHALWDRDVMRCRPETEGRGQNQRIGRLPRAWHKLREKSLFTLHLSDFGDLLHFAVFAHHQPELFALLAWENASAQRVRIQLVCGII
jgi:hypothetical protein